MSSSALYVAAYFFILRPKALILTNKNWPIQLEIRGINKWTINLWGNDVLSILYTSYQVEKVQKKNKRPVIKTNQIFWAKKAASAKNPQMALKKFKDRLL